MLDDLGFIRINRIEPLNNQNMMNKDQYSKNKNTNDIIETEFYKILENKIKNYKPWYMDIRKDAYLGLLKSSHLLGRG